MRARASVEVVVKKGVLVSVTATVMGVDYMGKTLRRDRKLDVSPEDKAETGCDCR